MARPEVEVRTKGFPIGTLLGVLLLVATTYFFWIRPMNAPDPEIKVEFEGNRSPAP